MMTLTAGANDARWANFIKACYARTCGTKSYDATAKAYIITMKTKLHYALASIERRSNDDPPRVIITGYYNPLSKACVSDKLTSKEISWLAGKTNAINSALRDVAEDYDFAEFVSLSFKGHDICSDEPWVQGIDEAAPFHPTAAGQEYIAKRVVAKAKN